MNERIQRFPGLPDYSGPPSGLFHAIHHADAIIEWSDNIMERVKFIQTEKAESERPIRLANLMYVGDQEWAAKYLAEWSAMYAKYGAEWNALDAKYQPERNALDAKYWAERNALHAKRRAERNVLDAKYQPFIQQLNPSSAWVVGSGLKFD